MLIVVRHAAPAASEDRAPETWELTAAGVVAARALAERLPADAVLVASPEPKALQTLAPAGPVQVDARFAEVVRTRERWHDDFCERRRRYVEGAAEPGWERPVDVAARFDAGVREHRERAGDRPLVVGTHGMALTTWLVAVGALRREDAGAFWAALGFPDALAVDDDLSRLRRWE